MPPKSWKEYYAKNRDERRSAAKEGMAKLRDSKPWSLPYIEGIDGESQNGKYVLLASSDRSPIYNSNGLSALEFIDYLLDAPKRAVLCGYVTHYDITKGLLSGLDEYERKRLVNFEWVTFNPSERNVTIRIHYIPHQTLEIWECERMENPNNPCLFSDNDKRRKKPLREVSWDYKPEKGFWKGRKPLKKIRHAILYSVEKFSSVGPFLDCMKGYRFECDWEFMESMKNLRGWSLWDDVPEDVLKEYNKLECDLTKAWMQGVLHFYHNIGIDLTRFNGYGSAASKMLRKLRAREHFQDQNIFTIDELSRLYIAGRSELFRHGEIQNVHYYDLKNAYVTAFSRIPSLSSDKVQWLTVESPSWEFLMFFGVSKVSWTAKTGEGEFWGPLPLRDTNGAIYFPTEGTGLYHNKELWEAIRRGNWEVKVEWTKIAVPFDENECPRQYSYPFADVRKMVDERAMMKKAIKTGSFGSDDFIVQVLEAVLGPEILSLFPSSVLDLYKGMGNSCYGKLAESPHGKQISRMNNLLFASFITSWCRAQILRHLDAESIIMTSTDSLICRKPIFGKNLRDGEAEWELKEVYSHGSF